MSIQPARPAAVSKDDFDDHAEEVVTYNDSAASSDFYSTPNDARDMRRMGKVQQMKRTFRKTSSLCFVCVLTGSWEFLLIANTTALTDGGRAGLFWTYLWSVAGMTPVNASMAEMVSIAPTTGGQYHWVSEFSPLKYQGLLSYLSGWLAVFSWQVASAASGTLVAGLIQAAVAIYNPGYAPAPYQTYLIALATFVFTNTFNVYGARYLPSIQNVMMVVHVFTLITIITLFWTLAPHPPASETLLKFENTGGWPTTGLAVCVGQVSALFVLQSGDCAAHISEEVKDARLTVPRSMFWGMAINYLLGFVLCVSYIFAIPDVDAALSDPSGLPFIYVLQQFLPRGGTLAITVILIVFIMASNISSNASSARQTFAFARDQGLPFSQWIGKVDDRLKIPANAVWATMIISILLNLVVLGSTTAFNALLSLTVVAITSTYTLSISVMLWRRLSQPETLPECYWSLGRFGVAINAASIAYCIFALFFCFWPQSPGFDVTTFNWAPVMYVGAGLLAAAMYFVHGRRVYKGPVSTVEGREAEARLEGFEPCKPPKL